MRRPLPYLYLARSVFGASGIPFETLDTLPLAAEPYAAALDLVLDAVASRFGRTGAGRTAALAAFAVRRRCWRVRRSRRSPRWIARLPTRDTWVGSIDWSPVGPVGLDHRVKAAARSAAGTDRVRRWMSRSRWRGSSRLLATAVSCRTSSRSCRRFWPVITATPDHDVEIERTARVRRAVTGALAALAAAYAAHDPEAEATGAELSSTIRRWLGAQTFASGSGAPGVRVLDAQAARFADVDDAQLLGLVEGEWPERARRSIFYPPFLLGLLDPAPAEVDPNRRESETMAAARAAFVDLLSPGAPARARVGFRARVRCGGRALAFRRRDLARSACRCRSKPRRLRPRSSVDEALLAVPPVLEPVLPWRASWAVLRAERPDTDDRRFLGEAGPWVFPRVSVSRIDRYLKCPFQFFASEVLELEEEPEDADLPPPLERGRFLHAIFETFFREWQQPRPRRIARRRRARSARRCSKHQRARAGGLARHTRRGSSGRVCTAPPPAPASSIACSRWRPNGPRSSIGA